ncbi:MAG: hypothetical protein JWQ40_4452 [Segetibacter sp.]|nr:hypothetical protein [Segetibacter sp.]
MIRTALEFIKKELETYIVDREQDPANYSAGNVVDLKSIMLPNGSINITDTTHITIMVVGVDEERREGKRPYYTPTDDKQFLRLNPPVELDLYILFAAHNSSYETSLRDLSDVVSFFQANTIFDEKKFPALNAGVADSIIKPWQLIERLTFRLHTLSFEQQNNLWGMVGSKYLPNVVYKMNMLTVFDTKGKEKVASVTELNFNEN